MQNLVYPFSYALLFLYNLVNNYGLALILFTILIKLITLPFTAKSKKSMMKISRLSPKLKELEVKYANDRMKYNTEVNNLYRSENVKPTAGCLWQMFPLVIMILLYSIIRQPYTSMFGLSAEEYDVLKTGLESLGVNVTDIIGSVRAAYAELPVAQAVHANFAGLVNLAQSNAGLADIMKVIQDVNFDFLGVNLSEVPKFTFFLEEGVWQSPDLWNRVGLFLIPILAGASQLFASIVSQKTNDSVSQGVTTTAASTTKMMVYLMPLVSVWFAFVMPAGIGVYWIANSLTTVLQDTILTKHYRKVYDEEDAEKARIEAAQREREEARQAERERKAALGIASTVNPNTSKKKLDAQNKKPVEPPQKPLEKMSPKELMEYAKQMEELEKKQKKDDSPGQVDDRPYARGRSYDPERFSESGGEVSAAESTQEPRQETEADGDVQNEI
ncbi:MAG: membrane protein insertase YidC [Oscillospiraceae bacterium]|nr:membrane protein insertase YidC [Oscillospiraceae bacterium]